MLSEISKVMMSFKFTRVIFTERRYFRLRSLNRALRLSFQLGEMEFHLKLATLHPRMHSTGGRVDGVQPDSCIGGIGLNMDLT